MTEKQKYIALLEQYPRLRHYWSGEGRDMVCTITAENWPYQLSHGEQIVLRVLVSIWAGSGKDEHLQMDITDLTLIDSQNRQPLLDWLASPFWP